MRYRNLLPGRKFRRVSYAEFADQDVLLFS